MGTIVDLRGHRYGRLLVLNHDPNKMGAKLHWRCRCDCGTEKWVGGNNMRTGKVRSCGCLLEEVAGRHAKTHGMCDHPLYSVWGTMLTRCRNANRPRWKDYGGRGIKVCKRWEKFENFFEDMHSTYLPGLTLDRRNNDRGYTPKNCKWSTPTEQAMNTRRSVVLSRPNGSKVVLSEFSKATGIHIETLRSRIKARGTHNAAELM